MFGLGKPRGKRDYNYRELDKQKKEDTKELKKLEERRRKLHDNDMPEGLRNLERALEREESLREQKKGNINEKVSEPTQDKKGFLNNIFKRSKNQQKQEETPKTGDTDKTSPARSFANDEERIINCDEPYEILGVTKNNTFEQISEVYKRLQKNYLETDLRDKTTEERKMINTILIKINKSYAKIRSSHYANLNSQNRYSEKPSTKFMKFHSEEERILNSTDPFQILNLSPNSTMDEIKKNYKDLHRKYKLTGMINKPEAEVLRLTNLLQKINWAYTEIKKINGFS